MEREIKREKEISYVRERQRERGDFLDFSENRKCGRKRDIDRGREIFGYSDFFFFLLISIPKCLRNQLKLCAVAL